MIGLLLRPLRLIALLVLVAAAVAGAWLWRSAGSSTELSREDALAAFAERGGAGPRLPGAPRPGVYSYAQTGEERGGLGPVSVERGLPDEARYVVTPTPDGFLEELDLSREHVEATRYRVTPSGLRAVWRRTEVTFVGVGRDDRRELAPPPLHVPRPLRVGAAWSGRYRAGGLDVSHRSRALRREAVSVGGRRLPAVVIRVDSVTRGAHPGTRTDTLWWSPARALPLRWRIALDIGGPASLRTEADLTLRSAVPAT